MIIKNLDGEWQLLTENDGKIYSGRLPGCNYLDLMANGAMENPFWQRNEYEASKLARNDFEYSMIFDVSKAMLKQTFVDLVVTGLDTICTVFINENEVGRTNNIYRTWRFDIKNYLKEGNNKIRLDIKNPYEYFEKRDADMHLPNMGNDVKGLQYLRKTPCHFGWDWGPVLPPAGLVGHINIEAYDVRIDNIRIQQIHMVGNVRLSVSANLIGRSPASLICVCKIIDPDGYVSEYTAAPETDKVDFKIEINSPALWWCNGLGDQPLYEVELSVESENLSYDSCKRKIGLRTITLDTSPDEWGKQFRFLINNVPIFAKGANWIPSDVFITRTTYEDMDFYIRSAKRANMNMLRVWGGGMYESDVFYELCDQYGILVWQDFIFACAAYPFFDNEFLQNVHGEVIDNVRRLRHHACLALWCGNNETEILSILWRRKNEIYLSNRDFYHNTLREWVKAEDAETCYWPGSPSSGDPDIKHHNMKKGNTSGDSHLWQIWHGMQPIEHFRKYPTRFCSEFGMESMPSELAIQSFTDEKKINEFSPNMQSHQKSVGGNEKILFYLLTKYHNPTKFKDFIYLSQIVQANTVRFATDCWRRDIGRHNGALYWQYNDCWPVASWSGIDYCKQYKAVQYQARHFNKPICISNDYYKDRAELHVINEFPETFEGELRYEFCTFDGNRISDGFIPVYVDAVKASKVVILKFDQLLGAVSRNDALLHVSLFRESELIDEKVWLLVPDKTARLPKPHILVSCETNENIARVTLHSALFARYVFLNAHEVTAPWSDNFFDILPGSSVTVTVAVPNGMDKGEFERRLTIRTLTDVEAKNSAFWDKLLRLAMIFKKKNYLSWLLYKFI
jgi:beta-mannosidase